MISTGAVRRVFEARSTTPGPRLFERVVEWEMAVGHDDSDERVRLTVLAGMSTWSERHGGRVRPTSRPGSPDPAAIRGGR